MACVEADIDAAAGVLAAPPSVPEGVPWPMCEALRAGVEEDAGG